jgi:hypothetical protein
MEARMTDVTTSGGRELSSLPDGHTAEYYEGWNDGVKAAASGFIQKYSAVEIVYDSSNVAEHDDQVTGAAAIPDGTIDELDEPTRVVQRVRVPHPSLAIVILASITPVLVLFLFAFWLAGLPAALLAAVIGIYGPVIATIVFYYFHND